MAKVTIGILGLAIVGMLYLYSLIFMGVYESRGTSAFAVDDTSRSDNVQMQQDADRTVSVDGDINNDDNYITHRTTDYDIQTNDIPSNTDVSGVSTSAAGRYFTYEETENIKAYFSALYQVHVNSVYVGPAPFVRTENGNDIYAYSVTFGTNDGIVMSYYVDTAGVIYNNMDEYLAAFTGS